MGLTAAGGRWLYCRKTRVVQNFVVPPVLGRKRTLALANGEIPCGREPIIAKEQGSVTSAVTLLLEV